MGLIELKHFLLDRHEASLGEIATHFAADREMVRDMLEVWQRKGKVTSRPLPKCSGCNQCGAPPLQIYRWQG